jgi:hypothetical protein
MLLLVALSFSGLAQDRAGEIHGSVVVMAGKQAVSNAEIQARAKGGRTPVQLATTASDGTYVLRDLQPGTYDLRISATGFYSTEVHDVQLGGAAVSLPSIPLEVGLIADCGSKRPAYYGVGAGPVNSGAIGGTVISDNAVPIGGAIVTLYAKGKGRIGSVKTDGSGVFRFGNLPVEPQEFWLSIQHDDFFLEEVRLLVLFAGLETVYSPITLESCSPGHCQPDLKTIRVIRRCA